MKRTIRKQFLLTKEEAQDLQKKAKKACLHESTLIRKLIAGYEPKESPKEEFYDVMKELHKINDLLEMIAFRSGHLTEIDAMLIQHEIKRWHKFQADMERQFMSDGRSELKWQ